LYGVRETITGFAIKKEKFMQILEDNIGQHLVSRIKKNYVSNIRNYIQQHREIQARKFQTRIDYVDLSAFGVGVEFDDQDHFREGCEEIERRIKTYSSRFGPLVQRLRQLDDVVTKFMYQLIVLAERYDERTNMILEFKDVDNFQIELIEKILSKVNNFQEIMLKKK